MEQKRIRAANWPLSSLILDVSEPHSSYGHIVKVILHFHNLVSELVLHWFPSTFPGFRFNFLHSCPEIDFCHIDAFIIKSCVFLLVNLILAAYVFFTCGSMTTFVMMLDVLHWLPAEQRISYRIASLVSGCLFGLAPVYLRELCCPPLSAMSSRSFRSTQQGLLLVPFARTAANQIRAFSVVGPSTWNGLPSELRIYSPAISLRSAISLRPLRSLDRHDLFVRVRGLLWLRHEPLQSLQALRFGTNSFLLLDPLY